MTIVFYKYIPAKSIVNDQFVSCPAHNNYQVDQ